MYKGLSKLIARRKRVQDWYYRGDVMVSLNDYGLVKKIGWDARKMAEGNYSVGEGAAWPQNIEVLD